MNARHYQHTLRRSIDCIGIGLHSGRSVGMTVRPAPAGSGVVFVRRDVPLGQRRVPAVWHRVSATDLSTTLTNAHGVSVATVEHLLAALHGCGVDNAVVELDSGEVPIMDGSARPFVSLIQHTGLRIQHAPRDVIWLHRAVQVSAGERTALLMPGTGSRFTVSIDFAHAAVGSQSLSLTLGRNRFAEIVAGARTFGFESDVAALKARGLALGGSLRNAVVVGEQGVVNPDGLRYADEFVRHKVLDCVGDVSLAGAPIAGHFLGHKPGHALNQALLQALFEQPDAWTRLPMAEYDAIQRQLGAGHGHPDERPGISTAVRPG